MSEVTDKQVHQRLGGGPDAVVGAGRARQLADEEDEGAQAGAQLTVLGLVPLFADDLVVFALQLAGVQEVGGNLVVDEIAGDDGAERGGGRLAGGLEDDLLL